MTWRPFTRAQLARMRKARRKAERRTRRERFRAAALEQVRAHLEHGGGADVGGLWRGLGFKVSKPRIRAALVRLATERRTFANHGSAITSRPRWSRKLGRAETFTMHTLQRCTCGAFPLPHGIGRREAGELHTTEFCTGRAARSA